MSSTYKISERTIARRILTSQRENENVACGASSQPDTPAVSRDLWVIASFLRPGRHLLTARNYREVMCRRFRQRIKVINPGFASQ